jgi:hypothetical protein
MDRKPLNFGIKNNLFWIFFINTASLIGSKDNFLYIFFKKFFFCTFQFLRKINTRSSLIYVT